VADRGSPALARGKRDIGGAHEGVLLRGCQRGPGAGQARAGPRPEVADATGRRAGSNALDEQQELAVANVVHVGRLKQIVGVGRHHRDDGLAHALGERGEGRLAAVQVAVVVGAEEMAVCRVADDPHVYPESVSDVVCDGGGGTVGVEDLGRSPASRVGDVRVGAVSCVAVLVDEVPEFLRCHVDWVGC